MSRTLVRLALVLTLVICSYSFTGCASTVAPSGNGFAIQNDKSAIRGLPPLFWWTDGEEGYLSALLVNYHDKNYTLGVGGLAVLGKREFTYDADGNLSAYMSKWGFPLCLFGTYERIEWDAAQNAYVQDTGMVLGWFLEISFGKTVIGGSAMNAGFGAPAPAPAPAMNQPGAILGQPRTGGPSPAPMTGGGSISNVQLQPGIPVNVGTPQGTAWNWSTTVVPAGPSGNVNFHLNQNFAIQINGNKSVVTNTGIQVGTAQTWVAGQHTVQINGNGATITIYVDNQQVGAVNSTSVQSLQVSGQNGGNVISSMITR
ncbi:MAG: hypothetical protein NUW37_12275 [Planctomycetes bacterium]|nr:hypothetical protein [Planctomycetota bacterium]